MANIIYSHKKDTNYHACSSSCVFSYYGKGDKPGACSKSSNIPALQILGMVTANFGKCLFQYKHPTWKATHLVPKSYNNSDAKAPHSMALYPHRILRPARCLYQKHQKLMVCDCVLSDWEPNMIQQSYLKLADAWGIGLLKSFLKT